MIECLRGKASDRKGRLFVCACCRRIWQILSDELREAVTTVKRCADGAAIVTERKKLYLQFVVLLGLGKPEAGAKLKVVPKKTAKAPNGRWFDKPKVYTGNNNTPKKPRGR